MTSTSATRIRPQQPNLVAIVAKLTQHHYQADTRPPGCSYITMTIDSLENITHNVMLTSLSFPKRCIFVNCVLLTK